MNNSMYPNSMIPIEQESGSSESSYSNYEPVYGVYPNFVNYQNPSKLESFEFNYWPNYQNPTVPIDESASLGVCSNQTNIENLVVPSTVNYSPVDPTNHLLAFQQHQQPQHVYLTPTDSNPHDQSNWLGQNVDYSTVQGTSTPSMYRHYPTSCSIYSNNPLCDSSSVQWQTPAVVPIKFESPYSSPSYYEYSDSFNNCQELMKKEEKNDRSEEYLTTKSSSQLTGVPPRNPLNGKTRTRDKYRIVYTEKQRYELENEFTISHYISIPRKAALSLTLALSERQIKIWFQNRRAKERKLNKKRLQTSTHSLDHSHDGNSSSETGCESPKYYQNYP